MAIMLLLNDNNIKEFQKAVNEEMDKSIQHFQRDLVGIRTGRANTALVDEIKVACYNGTSIMKLKEVASVSTPEARLIVIQPWDKGVIGDIEKALTASDIGLTPVNDGNLIRLQLPEMSAERRDELAKILHKKLEDTRVAIRNVRKDFNNHIRDSEKKKHISQDHVTRLTEELQKITDAFIKQVELMATKKEQELKTI